MKYTQSGGNLNTKAASRPSGTDTHHMFIVSATKPNFESPPARKIPQIKTVFIEAPIREYAFIKSRMFL